MSKVLLKILSLIPRFFFFGFILLMFLAIGGMLLGSEIWSFGRSLVSLTWQETQGKVEEAFVYYERGSKGGSYRYRLRYSYEVNGEKFEGKRLRFIAEDDNKLETKEETEQMLSPYQPVGRTVTVYYNPYAPADSTLERTHSWTGFRVFCGTIFLVLFAILLMVLLDSFKKKKNADEKEFEDGNQRTERTQRKSKSRRTRRGQQRSDG
jgi:hypothetical protein